jgi:hypothetical protein
VNALDGFVTTPGSGAVDVFVKPPPATIASFPPSYFARPAVARYERINPDWRTNSKNVTFAWPCDEGNTRRMVQRVLGRLGVQDAAEVTT